MNEPPVPQRIPETIAISVLLVEDDPADAWAIIDALRNVSSPPDDVRHARTLDEALQALADAWGSHTRVVLLDLSLPDSPASSLARLREAAPAVPVIILTARDDEARALEAVQSGAQDYLIKGQATGGAIVRSMQYAILRLRCEEGLRRERDAAQTARFREQFIAILGHDLRNPLNTIAGSASILAGSAGLTDLQRGWVTRISASADRIARMIDDVLDFTRGRLGGGLPTRLTTNDVARLVREAVDDLRLAAPALELQLQGVQELWVECDADRVLQVMGNLLSNANRHSGGRAVLVTVEPWRRWGRIRVTHHGQPLPADAVSRLFDPFHRPADAGGKPVDDGLGLGLYIARQIVIAHEGTIDVTSSVEEGTTVTVMLPRTAAGRA